MAGRPMLGPTPPQNANPKATQVSAERSVRAHPSWNGLPPEIKARVVDALVDFLPFDAAVQSVDDGKQTYIRPRAVMLAGLGSLSLTDRTCYALCVPHLWKVVALPSDNLDILSSLAYEILPRNGIYVRNLVVRGSNIGEHGPNRNMQAWASSFQAEWLKLFDRVLSHTPHLEGLNACTGLPAGNPTKGCNRTRIAGSIAIRISRMTSLSRFILHPFSNLRLTEDYAAGMVINQKGVTTLTVGDVRLGERGSSSSLAEAIAGLPNLFVLMLVNIEGFDSCWSSPSYSSRTLRVLFLSRLQSPTTVLLDFITQFSTSLTGLFIVDVAARDNFDLNENRPPLKGPQLPVLSTFSVSGVELHHFFALMARLTPNLINLGIDYRDIPAQHLVRLILAGEVRNGQWGDSLKRVSVDVGPANPRMTLELASLQDACRSKRIKFTWGSLLGVAKGCEPVL